MPRRYLLLPAYHFIISRMCCRTRSRLRRCCIAICLSSWHRVNSNTTRDICRPSIIGARGEATMPAWLWHEAFRVGTAPHEH